MRKNLFFLVAFCTFLAGPAMAQNQHQHQRPHDIAQYLERLDSQERDRSQKPAQVVGPSR